MSRWRRASLGIVGSLLLAGALATCPAGPAGAAQPAAGQSVASQPAATTPAGRQPADNPYWSMAWRSENAFPSTSSSTETCRMEALLTGAGTHLEVEFSPAPAGSHYTISRAAIAFTSGTNLEVSKPQYLAFAGGPSATVSSVPLRSDPVTMNAANGWNVAVTFVVSAGGVLGSSAANEPSACTTAGVSSLLTAPGSAFNTPINTQWLGAIYVDGPSRRTIAALGDSTTSTTGDTSAHHRRWSDALTGYGATVVNAGVSGGALTEPGVFGSLVGLQRAEALFAEPHITDLVMWLGENDIYIGVSTKGVLDGMNQVLAEAKAHHVRAYFCTFPPRGGAWGWTPAMETERQQVNGALRAWLAADGGTLIDADALLRNSGVPLFLAPQYDSGDHAHPTVAGDLALGKLVGRTLGLFR